MNKWFGGLRNHALRTFRVVVGVRRFSRQDRGAVFSFPWLGAELDHAVQGFGRMPVDQLNPQFSPGRVARRDGIEGRDASGALA